MISDARNPETRLDPEADVAIVGGGVAGITLARKLSKHARVVLIESGGIEPDTATQELYDGEVLGQPYSLTATRLRFLGGTSNHWGGWCGIFDDIDFEPRAWIPHSGWPIRHRDIQPYYDEAAEILNLGRPDFNTSEIAPGIESILRAGSDWISTRVFRFSNPVTRFGEKYREALNENPDILTLLHANLSEIMLDKSGRRVEHLKIRTLTGRSGEVRPTWVILACGAIENARVLLASNRQSSNGIGNDHDLVGRYFMEHPHVELAHLQFHDQSWCRAASDLRRHEEHWFGIGTTLSAAAQRQFHCLNFTGHMFERDCENEVPMKFGAIAEQAPNPDSRVTLGDDFDALGMPRVRLEWRLSELDWHSLRTAGEIVGREFGRANIGRAMIPATFFADDPRSAQGYGSHQMGTTRMAASPATGVVDSNCRVFGIDNLYVAGSSIYPTGGPINPTFTLVALTLRLAEHLSGQLAY